MDARYGGAVPWKGEIAGFVRHRAGLALAMNGWMLRVLACVLTMVTLGGCGTPGMALRSAQGRGTLDPDFTTRCYIPTDDKAGADVYLTDLPPELWRLDSDLAGISGTIVHVHLFLRPRAGKTPQVETASNLNIRYVVIGRGAVGAYAGGGFLLPSGTPGDETFGGRIDRASLRLARASEGFKDLLGPCELSGRFRAERNEAAARLIEARMGQVMEMAGTKK